MALGLGEICRLLLVQALIKRNAFECDGCEVTRLQREGYDLSEGHWAFVCGLCNATFDDENKARALASLAVPRNASFKTHVHASCRCRRSDLWWRRRGAGADGYGC